MELFKNKKFIISIIITGLIYAIFIFLYRNSGLTPEAVQTFFNSFGFSGYLTLFLSQFIMSLTPLPDSILAVMGDVLYGPIIGTAIVYSAMMLAAICHYFFARKMGQKYVMKHIPEAMPLIQKVHGDNVFFKLVLIRVFSVIAFDLSAYVAGVAGVRFKTFILSTAVGLIPIMINNYLLSQGIAAKSWNEFIMIVIAYTAFTLASWILSKVLKKVEGL